MLVARGITRTVFLSRRFAIKIPSMRTNGDGVRGFVWSFTRGIQANLSEIEWSSSPGVNPVIKSYWGFINVYRRLEQPLVTKKALDNVKFLCPADKKESNLGMLNGQLVYIDYDGSWNDCLCGGGTTDLNR